MSTKSKQFARMTKSIKILEDEDLWDFVLQPSEIENVEDINLDPCAYDYPDVKQ